MLAWGMHVGCGNKDVSYTGYWQRYGMLLTTLSAARDLAGYYCGTLVFSDFRADLSGDETYGAWVMSVTGNTFSNWSVCLSSLIGAPINDTMRVCTNPTKIESLRLHNDLRHLLGRVKKWHSHAQTSNIAFIRNEDLLH